MKVNVEFAKDIAKEKEVNDEELGPQERSDRGGSGFKTL